MLKLFFYPINMGNNYLLLWYPLLYARSYDIGKKCIVSGCTMTCKARNTWGTTLWWKGCKHTTTQFNFKHCLHSTYLKTGVKWWAHD